MSYEQIRHFRTPEKFNDYLITLLPPKWFKLIITHHTFIPTIDTWRGISTMRGILKYYKGKGWDRFPHIFVGPDGIWLMNKLTETGIHANAANPISIGVEMVGNYDTQLWPEPIRTYGFKVHAYLAKWGKIPLMHIQPHRQYNPFKTCPGKAISMDWVRNGVQAYLVTMNERIFKVRSELPNGKSLDYINIRQAPHQYAKTAGKLYAGDIVKSIAVKDDERHETIYGKSQWIHVTKAINVRGEDVSNSGFAHITLFEEIT